MSHYAKATLWRSHREKCAAQHKATEQPPAFNASAAHLPADTIQPSPPRPPHWLSKWRILLPIQDFFGPTLESLHLQIARPKAFPWSPAAFCNYPLLEAYIERFVKCHLTASARGFGYIKQITNSRKLKAMHNTLENQGSRTSLQCFPFQSSTPHTGAE